jgi:hypothetical protein
MGFRDVRIGLPGCERLLRIVVVWIPLACAAGAPVASSWPPQLEMRVPFEPTAFPSADRTYLVYELYLTNFATNPITLRRVEVLDADGVSTKPIDAFKAGQLDALLQPVGAATPADPETPVSRTCISRSRLHLSRWLAKVCLISSTGTALSRRTMPRRYAPASSPWGTH